MKKITILYIINDYKDLSINRRILDLTTTLPSSRYTIFLLSLNTKGTLRSQFKCLPNITIIAPQRSLKQQLFQLKQLIDHHQIDIIHTQTLKPDTLVYLTKMITNHRPIHISTRGYDFFPIFQPTHVLKNFYYFISLHLSDHNISVSQTFYKKFITKYHVPRSKLTYIPNGVELPTSTHSSTNLREKLNLSQTTPIILYSGRFIKRKNLRQLIHSLKLLPQNTNYHAILLGKGPQKKHLRLLIKTLRLNHHISILPFTQDTQTYLQQSDVYVLPSINEGLSNSLLEAMANKLPVIAKDIPNNRELIKHNKTGLLYSTTEQLTNQLTQLISDPKLRKKLSAQAHTQIKAKFLRKNMLQAYQDLYSQLLKQQH